MSKLLSFFPNDLIISITRAQRFYYFLHMALKYYKRAVSPMGPPTFY